MDSRIREAILATVPADGSRIGNRALIRQVLDQLDGATDEEQVNAVRERLFRISSPCSRTNYG